MTMTAAELVASKKHILLDFDGPICAAFAGYGASNISRQLATLISQGGNHVPSKLFESTDPFELLRYAAIFGDPDLLAEVDAEFRRLEALAVRIAPATPDTINVLHALAAVGHTITIVSNNSTDAVHTYARRHRIAELLAGVSARSEPDPSLLKPNPYLLIEALNDRGASSAEGLMVGDSETDIEAAHNAATAVIAFANKPAKRDRLARCQPDAMIAQMRDLLLTGP